MSVDAFKRSPIICGSLVTSNRWQVKFQTAIGCMRHLFFDNLVDNLLLNSWSDLSDFDFSKL